MEQLHIFFWTNTSSLAKHHLKMIDVFLTFWNTVFMGVFCVLKLFSGLPVQLCWSEKPHTTTCVLILPSNPDSTGWCYLVHKTSRPSHLLYGFYHHKITSFDVFTLNYTFPLKLLPLPFCCVCFWLIDRGSLFFPLMSLCHLILSVCLFISHSSRVYWVYPRC